MATTTKTKTYATPRTARAAIARKHQDCEVELLCHLAEREYSVDVRDPETREIITSYRLRRTMYGTRIV